MIDAYRRWPASYFIAAADTEGTEHEQSGDFMHELGQNLWLMLGRIYALNYQSVMYIASRRAAPGTRWWIVLLSAFGLLHLSGCYAATVGAILGILSLTDQPPPGPSLPTVVSFELVNTSSVSRPANLQEVGLSVSIAESTKEPADVLVEFSRDGSTFQKARIKDSTTGLPTLPEGKTTVLTWLAEEDGLSGLVEVDLRITPRDSDGEGFPATLSRKFIGNTPPVISGIVAELGPGEEASGNVVISYILEDSTEDTCGVELLVCGDSSSQECFLPVCSPSSPTDQSGCTASLKGELTAIIPGLQRYLSWNSEATLGRSDVEVQVALIADDGLLYNGRGVRAVSKSFHVNNNSPPEAFVLETAADSDGEGSVLVSFLLRDFEGEPADAVLQWSTESNCFPDVSALEDPIVRRHALLDPDERSALQLITPRLRVLLEGQCRGTDRGSVELFNVHPPAAFSRRFEGMTLEILSDTRAVVEARRIVSVDPKSRRLTLESMLESPPRPGQLALVRESADQLFLDLQASRDGLVHYVAWDVPTDAGPMLPEGSYFLRSRAFKADGKRSGPPFTIRFPKTITTRGASILERVAVPAMEGLNCAIVADLNADGQLDLACTEFNELAVRNQIAIYLQEDGIFKRKLPVLVTGKGPRFLLSGDFNEDGHLDLVCSDTESDPSELSLFVGQGEARFSDRICLRTGGESPGRAIAVFLRKDLHLDLVVPTYEINPALSRACLRELLGSGKGYFGGFSCVRTDVRPSSIIAADLNEDGEVDFISADSDLSSSADLSRLSVFQSPDYAGSFKSTSTVGTGKGPTAVTAADLNADGHLDVVSVDTLDDQLSVFLGDGKGNLQRVPDAEPPQTGDGPFAVLAADLDGDGVLDLISADGRSDQLSFFSGLGGGRFAKSSVFVTGAESNSLSAADLDGDQLLDLVTADSGSSEISILHGSSGLSFDPPLKLGTGSNPLFLLACDLDGDGLFDLVTADSGDDQLSIFTGRGFGQFSAGQTIDTGDRPRSLAAADLNHDGWLDLICANSVSNDLSIFQGGEGGLSQPTQGPVRLQTGKGPACVLSEDLNGDDYPDLVSANFEDGGLDQLSIFFGNEQGFSEATAVHCPSGSSRFVASADLDRDGTLDLVSADTIPGKLDAGSLSVFWGIPGPDCTPGTTLKVGRAPGCILIVDLNEDGWEDLVSSDDGNDLGSERVSVFLGAGARRFEAPQKLQGTSLPSFFDLGSLAAGDLDGDGHLDLMSVDPNLNRLLIYRGMGGGRFGPPLLLETGSRPSGVVSVDLDGDGTLDLASADNGVSIFLSRVCRTETPRLKGIPRASSPSPGSGEKSFDFLPGRHTIDTSSGTIDGKPWPDFKGHAFHFSSITIGKGVTVAAFGEYPLVLLSLGDVELQGELRCEGAPGGSGKPPLQYSGNSGSAGGRGGPGAGTGGAGGGTYPGTGTVHGRRGEGPGGGEGGELASETAAAGGGGGFGTQGEGAGPRRAGSTYGDQLFLPLFGGSGGGGGSIQDGTFGPKGILNGGDEQGEGGDVGGGGGGGGGGAVRIAAGGTIVIKGVISADGGDGGAGRKNLGGNGGGGSGGSVLLQAFGKITIEEDASITAQGGQGGSGGMAPAGGSGGQGRIRFEDPGGEVIQGGRVDPAPSWGSIGPRNDPVARDLHSCVP